MTDRQARSVSLPEVSRRPRLVGEGRFLGARPRLTIGCFPFGAGRPAGLAAMGDSGRRARHYAAVVDAEGALDLRDGVLMALISLLTTWLVSKMGAKFGIER